MRDKTVCFDGDRKHVISNPFDIDGHDGLVFLDSLGSELDLDEFLRLLRDDPTGRMNTELILEDLIVAKDFQMVGELY